MGCFGGGGGAQVSMSDQRIQNETAGISRELYDDYLNRFRPFEDAAVQDNLTGAGAEQRLQDTSDQMNQAWDASEGISSRALSGYGVNLSADQKASQARRTKQNRSAGIASSMNDARDIEEDRQIVTGDQLFATGRQVQDNALGGLSSASGIELGRAQRNVSAQNQADQQSASNKQAAAGVATTIAMMFAMSSSKKAKKNIKKEDDGKMLDSVRDMPVSSYEYKDPNAPLQSSGRKVGPMREDMPQSVQLPNGKVDGQNLIGTLTGAVRALDQKVQALEAR